jgi:hypothetical protein
MILRRIKTSNQSKNWSTEPPKEPPYTLKYYPLISTIFENFVIAIFYQNDLEYMRIDMSDDGQMGFESPGK